MSSLVSYVLLCLFLGVILPRVGNITTQSPFSLLDIPHNSAVVNAAPTSGYGAGGSQGQLLAAVTLECDKCRMPIVAPAKRGFVNLVVPFDTHDDFRQSLAPSCRPTRPVKARERPRNTTVIFVTTLTLAHMVLGKGWHIELCGLTRHYLPEVRSHKSVPSECSSYR
jgi:hypothetical protein